MNDQLHTDGSSQTGNQPIQLSPLDALHEAYRDGKNDPNVKKFGEDVKETFHSIGDEISKLFE